MVTVGDVVPDYLDLCGEVVRTRDVLSNLDNRNHCNMHDELQSHFERLLQINQRLTVAREELTKKLNNWRLGIAIGLGGLSLPWSESLLQWFLLEFFPLLLHYPIPRHIERPG